MRTFTRSWSRRLASVAAHGRAASTVLVVVGMAALAVLAACTGGAGTPCPCTICQTSTAVLLTVTDDETGSGIDDFFVEVLRDGEPEQGSPEPLDCMEAFRDGNECGFGTGPGVYHVIVSAPGYETREAVVRVAAETNSDLCCRACLSAKPLRMALTPVSPAE